MNKDKLKQKKSSPEPLLKKPTETEREDSWNLRPSRLEECIGQQQVIESLQIAIAAAKGRGEPLDHILFYGAPGLGKTTFARIISTEMGRPSRALPGRPWSAAATWWRY